MEQLGLNNLKPGRQMKPDYQEEFEGCRNGCFIFGSIVLIILAIGSWMLFK